MSSADFEPPYWYIVVRAAKYLGIAPWELEERPQWLTNALEAEIIESNAEALYRQREQSRAKARRRT